MNYESEILKKEIVISEEHGEFVETFLFIDEQPKTVDLNIRLAARGSRAEITILYIGRNKDETDMHIMVTHEAPETYGRVIIKAALFDESRLAVKGMLGIGEGAMGADSYLLAKALLVSPKARAEIRPELEILTDEVKASHGTSIGRIDERQLFYLQSRGIEKAEGEKLLLAEFFRDVTSAMPIEDRGKFFQNDTK